MADNRGARFGYWLNGGKSITMSIKRYRDGKESNDGHNQAPGAAAHPGEILNEEFIKPLGITVNTQALALRVPANRLRR